MIKSEFSTQADIMLSPEKSRYTVPGLSASTDIKGIYFPDAVIESFTSEAGLTVPKMTEADKVKSAALASLTKPDYSGIRLEDAKTLIVDALTKFDPLLGDKAREIFGDPQRLNLREIPPGKDRTMMACRPAGLTAEDLKARGMEITDPEILEKFPDANENTQDYAIIDYEYDGTVSSLIYLAHELGHAVADDYQRSNGHSHRDNPEHMVETQAYLFQHIVYDHLQNHEKLGDAVKQQFAGTMAENLYDFPVSAAAMDALNAMRDGRSVNPATICARRFGDNWEQFKDNYTPAGTVFDNISRLQDAASDEQRAEAQQALESEARRLHERPAAIYAALSAYLSVKNQDISIKREMTDALLGRNGPRSMNEVLAKGGIRHSADMQNLAQTTVQAATAYLHDRQDVSPDQSLAPTGPQPSAFVNL